MRRHHALTGGARELNENLSPLRRYLERQIGRSWRRQGALVSAALCCREGRQSSARGESVVACRSQPLPGCSIVWRSPPTVSSGGSTVLVQAASCADDDREQVLVGLPACGSPARDRANRAAGSAACPRRGQRSPLPLGDRQDWRAENDADAPRLPYVPRDRNHGLSRSRRHARKRAVPDGRVAPLGQAANSCKETLVFGDCRIV